MGFCPSNFYSETVRDHEIGNRDWIIVSIRPKVYLTKFGEVRRFLVKVLQNLHEITLDFSVKKFRNEWFFLSNGDTR